jgi:hypothetical protein
VADDDLEALRRRLYAPGASEEDRRRYAAAVPATRADTTAPAPGGPRPAARRRGRVPLVLLAVVVVVAAGGALAAGRFAPVRTAAPTPSAVRSTADPSSGIVSGTAQRVPVDVSGYATVAQKLQGLGEARVPLDTTAAPRGGGRLVVVLTSTDRRPIGWWALRFGHVGDARTVPVVIGSGAPKPRTGVPMVESTLWAGGPPQSVAVRAAPGVPWTLTVAMVPVDSTALR